jgi:hypothetical protein
MVERRQHLGFALEPLQPLAILRQGFREDLQRDLAGEPRVTRAPDLAHGSRAKFRNDLVRTELRAGSERHAATPSCSEGST